MTVDDTITNSLNSSTLKQLNLEPPIEIPSGTPVFEAVDKMSDNGFGCILVTDGGKLVGIFTERDVLLKISISDVNESQSVDEFMTKEPDTLKVTNTLSDAVREMSSRGYRHLPIMDEENSKCVGIITAKQIIKYVVEFIPEQVYNLPPSLDQSMLTPEGG
ncbi:MAG: CBS domain-containing protein [Candidatus Marinimicrobia bacterium]|nr:CBS domain-containing protein [Candidatus Neomarinimicrobiota bacterium]MCH7954416.1 CBS domain-containing protein [Candidatus Neomarinimicrobiota bacterium]